MEDPSLRERLIAEAKEIDPELAQFTDAERVFPLSGAPDYEPPRESSVASRARRLGVDPLEVFYDDLMVDQGRALMMRPLLNYSDFNLDPVREMLLHPTSTWGLGDGGAHCRTTCDASTPTYMLTHWARDRAEGRLPLEWVVKKMTNDTATMFGLGDRGTLEPGKVGDLNLIDMDALGLDLPEMVEDLPGGANRFIQRSHGYVATIKRGEPTFLDGQDEGARPGALIRGARGDGG